MSWTSIREKTGLKSGPRYGFTSWRHNRAKYDSVLSHCRDSHRLTVRSETLCIRQWRHTLQLSGYMLEHVHVGRVKKDAVCLDGNMSLCCFCSSAKHTFVNPFLCLTDWFISTCRPKQTGETVGSDHDLAPRKRVKVKEQSEEGDQVRPQRENKISWRLLVMLEMKNCPRTVTYFWHSWLHEIIEAFKSFTNNVPFSLAFVQLLQFAYSTDEMFTSTLESEYIHL